MRSSRRASQASKWRPLADLPRPPPPPPSGALPLSAGCWARARKWEEESGQGSARLFPDPVARARAAGEREGRRVSESSQ